MGKISWAEDGVHFELDDDLRLVAMRDGQVLVGQEGRGAHVGQRRV